ncbi:MnuA family membrane nuclease [Mycoplasmopsis glycophila]|uniref:Membrane nuclease MnuA n=1 Tax=Mycoplasmopsis glycophila TaxID=171285 RepID=A0A449AVB0_9BACT|nr:hypothetical protein [Mycoplasmopsis glycophila]VEU70418.1 Uncharacterised protein [Mycoplasmopsis glycophila]
MTKKQNTKKRSKKGTSWLISSLTLLVALGAGGYSAYHYLYKNKTNTQKTNSSESQVPNPTTVNGKLALDPNKIRLMNWNILNFGGNNDSKVLLPKINNIAKAILYSNSSVVGFTEINYINPKDRKTNVVESLENLQKLLGENWKFIYSDDAVNPKMPNSKENYAIFYDSSIIKYEDYKENITKDNLYARAPFLAKFSVKENNYQFYYAIAHFDAPGVNTNNGETKDSVYTENGTQEIKEAKEVYEYIFKPKMNDNIDIIFAGDTNLKAKANEIFESFSKYGIQDAYVDFKNRLNDAWYNTSLSVTDAQGNYKRKYANPYDKWLFFDANDTNITVNGNAPYKIDIVGLYNEGIWNKREDIKIWKQNNIKFKDETDLTLARKVSDHAPIILDIKYK